MRRLILGIAIASIAAVVPVSVQAGDQEIANHIEQKLREANQDGRLKNFGLDLQVSEGVAWFKGYVATAEQEKFVLTTAQQAKHLGVVKIIDEIEVKTAVPAVLTETSSSRKVAQPAVSEQPAVSQQAIGTGSQEAYYNADPRQSAQAAQYYPAQQQQKQIIQQTTGQQVVLPPQRIPQQPMQAAMPRSTRPMAQVAQVPNVLPQVQPGAAGPAPMPMPQGVQANLQAPSYTPVVARQANAQYDHAQLPNYAWPSYAPSPNYGALTYPKQYSPSAWPYIGPFYPYPQVPLGWRKVTMEWDDGWWYLDFHDK